MNQINRQVSSARRRMITGAFFNILIWSALAGLLLAVVGLAIPKIWHLDFLTEQSLIDAWTYSWIIGGIVVSLLVAAGLTWSRRVSHLNAAVEVDKRFGLKERLSSVLALEDQELQSKAGQALVEDAESRAESLDVRDQFAYQPSWKALVPLAPIALLIGLMFIPNAEKKVVAEQPTDAIKKRVAVAVKEGKEKLKKQREQLVAKGLRDAVNKNLKSLEKKFDNLLDDKSDDKKQTLVKLNDIKKQIADRRSEIGDSAQLRKNLNRLKDIGKGPAKKLANAMSEGDMEGARKAIKQLADKLKAGDLSKVEMKKLAKDLRAMADALKAQARKHEEAKRKLQEQIKKALEQGDLDKAAKLQDQLDRKKQQDKQQQKMKDMADKLQKCANCANPGKGKPKQGGDNAKPSENAQQQMKQAGQELEDLAEQIEQMQQELEELEALEDLEDLAEAAKQSIRGEGGEGKGDDKPQWGDWAKGEGRGGGKRGLEKEDIGTFRSRVKGRVGKGETIVTGSADGKNITGRSVSEVRDLVKTSMSKTSDPLENQKLSKAQREHAQQYFKAIRENN